MGRGLDCVIRALSEATRPMNGSNFALSAKANAFQTWSKIERSPVWPEQSLCLTKSI